MKIIGGDFNAELGQGEGIDLSSVGHYTLNKANGRGEWMTQWLLEHNLVALNTMYKKPPQNQVTYHTQKGAEKQLDYILTDRKHYCWSKDAEANETIDMGSDHRCVMAKFEIPKERRKPCRKKAPGTDCERNTCDNDEHVTMYRDLEQEVKEADPKKIKKTTAKEATKAEARALTQKAAEAEAAALAASAAFSAAKEEDLIAMSTAAAAEGTEASEAQETKQKDKEILALIQEWKTTAKHEKERIREISKKIKNCTRENKKKDKTRTNPEDHGRVKGTRNISSIKSVKKRILITKVKSKEGETITTRQGIANVFAKFYEDLYEGEDRDTGQGTDSRTDEDGNHPEQQISIPDFTVNEIQDAIDRLKRRKSERQQWSTSRTAQKLQ